jgi:hypothetical protein
MNKELADSKEKLKKLTEINEVCTEVCSEILDYMKGYVDKFPSKKLLEKMPGVISKKIDEMAKKMETKPKYSYIRLSKKFVVETIPIKKMYIKRFVNEWLIFDGYGIGYYKCEKNIIHIYDTYKKTTKAVVNRYHCNKGKLHIISCNDIDKINDVKLCPSCYLHYSNRNDEWVNTLEKLANSCECQGKMTLKKTE